MSFSIPSRYHHSLLAVGLGLWLYVLLVFLAPYDVAPLGFSWRAKLMAGYGLIFALSYQFARLVELRFFKTLPFNWWVKQSYFILVLVCLNFPLVFWYYSSPLVLGEFSLVAFSFQIYLPTLIVVIPLMLYGRKQFERIPTSNNKQVVLRGENKRDVLQLPFEDILYLETARNYVTVHYRQQEVEVQKKLLRTTLKKVISEHPGLLQIHRSYVVNPGQITRWKGIKAIIINEQEIPVSDSYRMALLNHLETHP